MSEENKKGVESAPVQVELQEPNQEEIITQKVAKGHQKETQSDEEQPTIRETKKNKAQQEEEDNDDEEEEKTRKKKRKVVREEEEKGVDEEIITLRAKPGQLDLNEKGAKLGIEVVQNFPDAPIAKPQQELLRILDDPQNENDFILYKGKRIIHKQILREYVEENGRSNLTPFIKRVTAHQKIIETTEEKVVPLQESKQLKDFLASHSLNYGGCAGAQELARGGEAVVFRVEHFGLDEIVAKCTIFDENTPFSVIKNSYSTIFYESQMLKMLQNKDFMAEIKEEIIELNREKEIITRYCVIVERAQKTLGDVISTWVSEEEQESKKDYYTPEKLTYYFLQAMKGLQYCHDNNLYYGDMKTANLLVFRDQRCKIGDLGISVRVDFNDKDGQEQKYSLKGATPGFLPPQIEACVESGDQLSKQQLFDADIYALKVTLKKALMRLGQIINPSTEAFNDICSKKGFPSKEYSLENNLISIKRSSYFLEIFNDLSLFGLTATIKKWDKVLMEDDQFQIQLASHLLEKEYKYQATIEVFNLSRFKPEIEEIQRQFSKSKSAQINDALQSGLKQISDVFGKSQANYTKQNVGNLKKTFGGLGKIFKRDKAAQQKQEVQDLADQELEKELAEQQKLLEQHFDFIEEETIPDMEELEKKAEERKQASMQKEKINWDQFYRKLEQKQKEEWRRITTLLIKSYDSDKTNMLHQRFKQILVRNETKGEGNLFFGKRTIIHIKNISKFLHVRETVKQAIREDEKMFTYILQFLQMTSIDLQQVWFPLLEVVKEQAEFKKYELLVYLGITKSFSEMGDLKQTLAYGRYLNQEILKYQAGPGKENELQDEYLLVADYIISVSFKNQDFREAITEINNIKAYMMKKGIKFSLLQGKIEMVGAQIWLSSPEPDLKKKGKSAQEHASQSVKIFQELFGENSYYTMLAFKVLGECLYLQGSENQDQALRYFSKCYKHPSPLLQVLVLDSLKNFNSPKLGELIRSYELTSPFKVFIGDEIQLVAKASLCNYYGVKVISSDEEKDIPYCIVDNQATIAELFSEVEVLNIGLTMLMGQQPKARGFDGKLVMTMPDNYGALSDELQKKQYELMSQLRSYSMRVPRDQNYQNFVNRREDKRKNIMGGSSFQLSQSMIQAAPTKSVVMNPMGQPVAMNPMGQPIYLNPMGQPINPSLAAKK